MKSRALMGTVLIISGLSFSAFAAPGNKATALRESLSKYATEVKASAFGGKTTAKGLSAQKAQEAQAKMISELALGSDKNSSLSLSLSGEKQAQRLDNLATVVAAKKMAAEVGKTDASEGRALDAAATAAAKIIANASLVGARKTAKDLNTTEMSEVSAALNKLESLPESILTRFDKTERDSYVEIANKYDSLLDSGTLSAEEAFVKAIMDVKKVDKAKALEVVKKLKECV